jgi:hypothetical protein
MTERPERIRADHQPGNGKLRTKPRKRAEQGEAGEGLRPGGPLSHPQRQKRRAREACRARQLGIHGGAVREQRGREPAHKRGADRPRIRRYPQSEKVRQGARQRSDRRKEHLDRLGAADRERRGDQYRQADAVRLVERAVHRPPVAVEHVGIEGVVGAQAELVLHIEIAVVDERLRREQVVGLVAAVVRAAEGVKPERGHVRGEQDQPDERGAPLHAAPRPHVVVQGSISTSA